MVITKNAPKKQSELQTTKAGPISTIASLAQANAKMNAKDNLTRVVVHYDVGFNNSISIQGSGTNLSWEKGITLKNTRPDEWVWETDQVFDSCEFKVLINDSHYELGNNHTLNCHNCLEYTPIFFD